MSGECCKFQKSKRLDKCEFFGGLVRSNCGAISSLSSNKQSRLSRGTFEH
jgi:hypothetical protein